MVADEHVAVVSGVGARFPGAAGMGEFAEKLFAKAKLCRPDPDRWSEAAGDRPLFTGRIPDCDKFDSAFFGISTKLIRSCDPLMGQMLERSFEAIVDAGHNPLSLKGGNVSVLTATSLSDAVTFQISEGLPVDNFALIGHARTMTANRISFFLNLQGPSYSLDNSWASSAQALDMARRQIERGEVDAALVASTNLIYYNAIDTYYDCANWLSPDGECRPFDTKADGFTRSEATVCLFLQRASDARRSYCSVLKSKVCCLGDQPGGILQVGDRLGRFLEEFYEEAGVDPRKIGYVEASGLGIPEKDSQELNAIATAFKCDRTSPLLVGSVTGNIGFCEAPSLFASLAKVLIAMETGLIPPTVNYSDPNANVSALRDNEIMVLTEPSPLKSRLVAINGGSYGGTAAHILLENSSRSKSSNFDQTYHKLPKIVILQARNERGARNILDKVSSMTLDDEFISMVNNVFKIPIQPYLWRCYAVLPPIENDGKQQLKLCDSESRPVWWVFSGMGSQWPGMGRDLMALPPFAAAVERCRRALAPVGIDLKWVLESDDDPTVFDDIVNCFVGIATVQVGLVDVLRSVGVSFDGVVGHSVGELGCAYADGCLTAEQTVLAAYARGRASVETKLIPGMMAAVGLGHSRVRDQVPQSIDVACHNAFDSCTLSGPTEDVNKFVEQLKSRGVFAKAVSTAGIAYHSRYIKDIAPKLLQYLKQVISSPKPRSSRWVSSSAPESRWGTDEARLCSAEYHTNNLLSPVLFEEASKHIPNGAIVIEIAPKGLLQAILRRSLGQDTINLAMCSQVASSNIRLLLDCIGTLHLNNVLVDVNALYPPIQYPVSRSTPSLSELVTWDHDRAYYHEFDSHCKMLINQGGTEKYTDISKRSPDFVLWKEYCLRGQMVVPVSQLLVYTWKELCSTLKQESDISHMTFENVTIVERFIVNEHDKLASITILPNSYNFEIDSVSEGKLSRVNVMAGKLNKDEITLNGKKKKRKLGDVEDVVDAHGLYQELEYFGLKLSSKFHLIKKIYIGKSDCVAMVQWTGNLVAFLESFFNILIFLETDLKQQLHLPKFFIRLTVENAYFNLKRGSIVEVNYNRASNVLSCLGVELCGLSLRPVEHVPTALRWTDIKLRPYFDNKLSFQELVLASVRLVSEAGLKCWSKESKIAVIVVNSDTNSSLTMQLKDSINEQCKLNRCEAAVSEVSSIGAVLGVLPAGSAGLLLAADAALLPAAMEAVPRDCQLYCLVRLASDDNYSVQHPLIGIQEQAYILLSSRGKREYYVLIKRVPIKQEVKIFESKDPNWLCRLRKLVSSSNKEDDFVVVRNSTDPLMILSILSAEPYSHRLRIVFIGDSERKISFESAFFCDQVALGLPVSVLSNGGWNFLQGFSLHVSPHIENMLGPSIKSSDLKLSVDFIGVNPLAVSRKENHFNGVKHYDYSGTEGGVKVMGVGFYHSESKGLSPDKILKWKIPKKYSMQDAATIPVLYTLAYHCVRQKSKVQRGEVVLVNSALGAVGLAFVSVALEAGAVVLASVYDDEERKELIKHIPELRPSHVVLFGANMRADVLKIVPDGVDVVINFFNGSELQQAVQLVGKSLTRLIHLGHIRVEDQEKFGMGMFFYNSAFYGVTLDSITNCSEKYKLQLKEYVSNGISGGRVMPLPNHLFSNKQLEQVERVLKNTNTQSFKKKVIIANKKQDTTESYSNHLECSQEQYIVLVGPKTDDLLVLAIWLVGFGARKFIALSSTVFDNSWLLNKLVHESKSSVIFYPFSRLDTMKSSKELIDDIKNWGTVRSVFFVSMDRTRQQHMKSAYVSQSLTPAPAFVNLLGEGEGGGGCQGLSVVAAAGSRLAVRDLLPYLPSLLADPTQRRLLVNHAVSEITRIDAGQDRLPLPRTLDQLADLGRLAAGSPSFVEVPTLSPGRSHVLYDLLPVFIIPAVSPDGLQPLTSRLIHPAFCCNPIAFNGPVEDHAQHMVKDVLHVQTTGPYTLVGESWNGSVAMQMGILLEALGHQVSIVLLEALPSMVKVALRTLGGTSDEVGTTLISNCSIMPQQPGETIWSRLDALGGENGEAARLATSRLAARLAAVNSSPPPRQLFGGHMTLVTASQPLSADLDNLALYCKHHPAITVITEVQEYEQFLANRKTSSAVNGNALFSWST